MALNKKGQVTIFVSFMIGFVFLFLGINLAYPLSQVVNDARGAGQLNCSTVTSYQDKANCVTTDILLPLFVGTIMGLGAFILSGRML